MELRLRIAYAGRQEREHLVAGDGGERLVASHAAREGAEECLELKPPHDFLQLLFGVF